MTSIRRIFLAVLLIIVMLPQVVFSLGQNPRFLHLCIEDGLSQTTIKCMLQDRRGFMWLGTQDGLNRYDGHEIIVYVPDPENPNGLCSNEVLAIHEDSQGRLWIGTAGGLNSFDYETETFSGYKYDTEQEGPYASHPVTAIHEDHEGIVWVATAGRGLYSYNSLEDQFTAHHHDPSDARSLSNEIVNNVFEDRSDRLWVGTDDGLNLFDRESGEFLRYQNDPDTPHSLGNNTVLYITQDSKGLLWVGTGGGLYSFDGRESRFTAYVHDPADHRSIGRGIVTSILEDSFGDLWVGIDDDGLCLLDRETGYFERFAHDPYVEESLADNRVCSLFEDRAGVLWVGTFSRGVDRYDRFTAKFTPRHSRPDLTGDINDYVRAFLIDRTGLLWIATDGDGVTRLNRQTLEVRHYHGNSSLPNTLFSDQVYSICEDRSGTIWMGTAGGVIHEYDPQADNFIRHELPVPVGSSLRPNSIRVIRETSNGLLWLGTDGDGLYVFDPLTREARRYRENDPSFEILQTGRIFSLIEDRLGNRWIGVFGSGLVKLNPETGELTRYRHIPGNSNSLGSDQIMPLYEGQFGEIWIGSNGGGLARLEVDTETFTHFREEDGMANNAIYGIVEDNQGCLWLSHNKGLTCFDPRAKTYKNFTSGDGLQSNEFNGGAYYKSADGEVFFGGINGYNAFYPRDIRDNREVPPVVITDLQLFNHSVPIGERPDERTILTKSITETQNVTLNYGDRVVSFEYAALLYGSVDKHQFAYMMEGLDEEWSYVGNRRFTTYTHIPPGEYTFRVKASNGDGIWNEEGVALGITIVPPFWQTAWFITLASLAFLGGAWEIYRYRTRLIRVREKALKKSVRERTLELECEIAERKEIEKQLARAHDEAVQATKSKSEFLANMSHEIRTPMNGVLGMTQLLLDSKDLNVEDREQAETIYTSGEVLLTIINDILDFSKIEAGKMDIEPIPFDMQVAVSEVAELLAPKAWEKGLELVVRYAPDAPCHVVGDAGRIRQVILNLTGNAIKFTSSGHVEIEVEGWEEEATDSFIKVSIRDTGIGLSSKARKKLFQPFSQADGSTTRKFGGTGLGLAICRQLVDLMDGQIEVESKAGEGSTFWFSLRLPKAPHIAESPQIDVAGEADKRVMVVDGLEASSRVLEEQLSEMGLQPLTTQTAGEAFVRLREAAVASRPFPLAVVSNQLPDGDGEELVRMIKADTQTRETILMLLGSTDRPRDEESLTSQGVTGYLVKPIRPDTFRAIVAMSRKKFRSAEADAGRLVTRHTVTRMFAPDDPQASKKPKEPTGQNRRVLVVEDNTVNQHVAKRMLEKYGCIVDLAANGQEAVTMWSNFPYDVVFMDCQMPEMDGYEATGEIRRLEDGQRHTPIVAMTANAMEGDRELCLESGMDDYLAKPLRMDQCREMVDKWADGVPEETPTQYQTVRELS